MSKRRQSYEIQVNEHSLILTGKHPPETRLPTPHRIFMPYIGNKKALFQYLDTLEKSNRFDEIILESEDPRSTFKDLRSLCNWVPAAGGVIRNPKGQILMIYRKNFWDLPKGKLESGERSRQAAIRECMEEVGLKDLTIHTKIGVTWHLYREQDRSRSLKRTKWFVLDTQSPELTMPQKEEGIERVEWFNASDALELEPIYQNIKFIIQKYMNAFTPPSGAST